MADLPAEKLDEQIARLEAVVSEILTCASCGKALEPDKAACPHCGAIVGEKIELPKKAAQALAERAKPAEAPKPPAEAAPVAEPAAKPETTTEPKPEPEVEPEPKPEPKPEPETRAAPTAEPKPEPEAEAAPVAEVETEPEVHEEPPAEEEVEAAPIRPAKPSPPARVEVVSRDIEEPSSFRRPAVIASGMALYLVGLVAVLPLLGKYVSIAVMVLASVIVAAGVLLRGPEAPRRAGRERRAKLEFVCPLCGTEVPSGATECGTCGAQFET